MTRAIAVLALFAGTTALAWPASAQSNLAAEQDAFRKPGAAESGAFLDEGDLEAELRGAEGADVPAGAGADDDEVEGQGRHV